MSQDASQLPDTTPEVREITDQIGQLMARAGELQKAVAEGTREASEVKAELEALKPEFDQLHKDRLDKERDAALTDINKQIEDMRTAWRAPSKAALIGTGPQPTPGYVAGSFVTALKNARSRDASLQAAGKQALADMGVQAALAANSENGPLFVDADGKATLGDGASPGAGYLIPNNFVSSVIEQATASNPYRRLLQVVGGVRGRAVDIPTEGLVPVRAVVAAWGATKQEVDFTMPAYTATLYTIARIHDVSNQLLRHSAGAAEQLVRDKLSRALALGEAYYVLQGSGTSEPKGLLTAIGTSGQFVTSFTASSTTLAGSSASAIAKAAGVLANRARQPQGAVCNTGDFYVMLAQGTDNAGFFFAPAQGPDNIDPTRGTLTVFGIPVVADPNMPTDSMVVGEWKSAQLFLGDDFRVDVSSEAGTRWDSNITGFRGEEEIGFNGDPYVTSGLFQRITDFTP